MSHRCHWPGCPKLVAYEMWGCPTHWFRLPQQLRRRLFAAWTGGGAGEHQAAAEAIQEWLARQARATEEA